MSLKSHQIEIWAVTKVEETFSRSSRIIPSITRGDRGPVWDGAIYLYSSDDTLTRRIPVQVKGKTCKSLPKKPSYPITVTNLKNYLRDGGVLYCVVFILGEERLFYYSKLAPIDLKRYIKAAKGQASISVKLNPFDKSVTQMELELENFINDCKKQTSYVDAPILSIEDVIKNKHSINFQLSAIKSQDGTAFINEPVYLYAEMYDGNNKFYYPIGDQAYNITTGLPVNKPVTVKDKLYYNNYLVFQTDNEVSFNVGNVLTVHLKKENNILIPQKTHIETKSSMLSDKIHELIFINEIFNSSKVNIGGQELIFRDITDKQKEEATQELIYWQRARLLFNVLNINEDINIGSFTKTDKNNITMLIDAILDNKTIKHSQSLDIISHTDIAKYRICLITEKNEDGTYRVMDFFNSEQKLCFAYEDENGRKLATSMFTAAFQLNDFDKFSNVDYNKLIPSYEFAKKHNPFIVERANNDMLMAIKAYDKKEPKDLQLYDAIVSLNEWIINNATENLSIHIINKYQIIKRQRQLEKVEKMELFDLLSTADDNITIITAIHLLLDNDSLCEMYYDKLSPSEKQFFDSLPISFFRNKKYYI